MIVAQVLTDQQTDDSYQVVPLLEQVDKKIGKVTTDGAYDSTSTYRTVAQLGDDIAAVIPPRKTAVAGMDSRSPTQRDYHLEIINTQGRLAWQDATGYDQRAFVETTMGRYKSIIGPRLRARGFKARQIEAAIGVAVLNRMLEVGIQTPSVVRKYPLSASWIGELSPSTFKCTNATPKDQFLKLGRERLFRYSFHF